VLVNLAAWSLLLSLLGLVLFSASAARALRKLGFHCRPRLQGGLVAELLHYALFNWMSSAGILLFQSADRLLVGALIGPAAAGAYGIASSTASRVNMLAGQFTQALAPAASTYQTLGRPDEIRKLFINVSRVTSWVLIVTGSLLVIWMDRILAYWISPSFASQYAQLFRLMVIAYACFSLSRAAHQTLTGLGLVRITAFATVAGASLVLLMIYLLTPAYGLIGAAAGNFFYSFVLIMNIALAWRLGLRTTWTALADVLIPIASLLLIFRLSQVYPSLMARGLLSMGIAALALIQLMPYLRRLTRGRASRRRTLWGNAPGLVEK
jgi:O-antigen/teichoic acid export membrane protein